jgi:hypothetical protein
LVIFAVLTARPPVSDLQRQLNATRLKLLRANDELRTKQIYCERLEHLLHQRTEMVDALHGRIDQLREQNRKLDAEAERLAEMVRLS